jgi:tetratricopeptide (TPR) repeat protein
MSVRTTLLAAALVAASIFVARSQFGGEATPPAALAQGTQPLPPAVGGPVSAPASPPVATASAVKVDESALRYFAAQGDTRRLEAEIARLRALYPDWNPPADLGAGASSSAAGDGELDRIWKLFADGQLSEARSAIAARTASDSKWQPPQDLLDKLAVAEAGRRLVNASNGQQWATVLDVATQTPALLTCENIDALWRVAEAFAKSDKPDRARDAYRYVLVNCSNPGERLATVQKASSLLPDIEVRDLLKLERTGNDGKGEFASIRVDLAKTRVGRAALDPKITVEPDELALVERLARDGSSSDDALVVGYYFYSHGEPGRSLEWFKRAVERNGGARAAEGSALALIELKRFEEAEAVAEPFRSATAANTKAYLTAVTALFSQTPPPRVEAAVLTRATRAASDAKDAAGAQALGWYAYNIGQIETAAGWFSTSLEWQPDAEPAAFGLALSRQRLRDRAGLQRIVAQWRDRSERIADLLSTRRRPAAAAEVPPPPPRVPDPGPTSTSNTRTRTIVAEAAEPPPAATRRANPENCRSGLSAAQVQSLSAGAALARGWCLLDLKRPVEAAAAFEVAQRRGNTQTAADAAYGRSLAYLASGLTADAALAASGGALPLGRRSEVAVELATQRALAAYREGRYEEALISLDERARLRPEQTDLLMLRGWSYFNLGRYGDAEKVFTAVSKTASPESEQALRGLNVIGQRLGRIRE